MLRTIAGNKPDKTSADPRVYSLEGVTKNNDLSKQDLVAYAVTLGIGEAEADVLASLSNRNKTDNSKTTTVIMTHHSTRQLIASGKGLKATRYRDFTSEGGPHWEREPAIRGLVGRALPGQGNSGGSGASVKADQR